MILALPEAATTETSLRLLKKRSPHLPVSVRVHCGVDIPRMRNAGADTVIHADFEASTEMIRQGLQRQKIFPNEITDYLDAVREYRYRQEET